MTCPRCNYPEIYTEGENRVYECYCGNCFLHLNSTQRKEYFKFLKDNGLHIIRPENYELYEGELDLMRIENAKLLQKQHQFKWRKNNPEKYKENKELVRDINRARYYADIEYRERINAKARENHRGNKKRYDPSEL